MKKTKEFLAELGGDVEKIKRFIATEDDTFLVENGLSVHQSKILRSGYQGLLDAQVEAEEQAASGVRLEKEVLDLLDSRSRDRKANQLIVVGMGIAIGQLTLESLAWMQKADVLYYVAGDGIGEAMLQSLNKNAISLKSFYAPGKNRNETYAQMVETLVDSVDKHKLTVGAFYGHPSIFSYPPCEAIRQLKAKGLRARMLPGISAEDCLFADLTIDPGSTGCLSYEATDLLINNRKLDNTSKVILWQIGFVMDFAFQDKGYDNPGLPDLLERLYQYYPKDHVVTVYEAATMLGCEPYIDAMPLSELANATLNSASTLYIPPLVK